MPERAESTDLRKEKNIQISKSSEKRQGSKQVKGQHTGCVAIILLLSFWGSRGLILALFLRRRLYSEYAFDCFDDDMFIVAYSFCAQMADRNVTERKVHG
jgi:hypothetical protein